jgi:hypothetical protein
MTGNKPVDFAKELAALKNNLKYLVEFEKEMAVVTRYKYDALIEQGFTEAQAIELCKR